MASHEAEDRFEERIFNDDFDATPGGAAAVDSRKDTAGVGPG
jgi:hypothetical protein